MGIGSIVVGVASFLFMFGGVLFTIFPVFGSALSFLAPLLAIAGTVMGGISYSRAKREGASTGAPLAGIIVNAIAFLPAVAVAMTCGLCNACITAQSVNPPRPPDGGWPAADASVTPGTPPPGAPPPAFPPPPMDPGTGTGAGAGTGTGTGVGTGAGAGAGAGTAPAEPADPTRSIGVPPGGP